MALTVSGLTITGGLSVTSYTPGYQVDYLVIAGGGAGGNKRGGGGGAGGFQSGQLTARPNDTYTISVGAGGAYSGTASSIGNNGGDSTMSSQRNTITARGGGAGGTGTYAGHRNGVSGGSGGGAGSSDGSGSSFGGSGISGQGNKGGDATHGYGGGGGGGAGGAGANQPTSNYGGAGGIGLDWPTGSGTISGTSIWNSRELVGTLDLVAKTNAGWGTFMNTYAIWHTSSSSTVTIDQTVTVTFPYTGLYFIQAAADNGVTVYIDGVSRLTTTSYTSSVTIDIPLAVGSHDIRIVADNSGGAGGVSVLVATQTSNYYAGGGGGGERYASGGGGAGGLGGGGAGGDVNGTSGASNTGSGGGGAGDGPTYHGGSGGSGLAAVRYSDAYPESAATGATYSLADGYRTYTWASSGTIRFFSPFTAVDLTYDPTWSGGGFTVDGNTVTTTSQFASVLYAIQQTSGKIYLEFTVISEVGDGYGWYVGVQRVPTRVGNYHNGTTGNGNGGAGTAWGYPSLTPTHTYGVLIDLDAQTVAWNGAAAVAIPGSGQLYFAVYDGTSSGTGSGSINWGTSSFVNSVPAGAIPAGSI